MKTVTKLTPVVVKPSSSFMFKHLSVMISCMLISVSFLSAALSPYYTCHLSSSLTFPLSVITVPFNTFLLYGFHIFPSFIISPSHPNHRPGSPRHHLRSQNQSGYRNSIPQHPCNHPDPCKKRYFSLKRNCCSSLKKYCSCLPPSG